MAASAPDALFLAPHAPQRSGFGSGYQWWLPTVFAPQALAAGAASAAAAIDACIDRKLEQYGLSAENLAIVGFSQDTMTALHVGLRRKNAVAGIVGYSGILTGGRDLARAIVTKPPVLLIHGSADRVVPVAALHDAETQLRRAGVEVTTHVSTGVGHTVDSVGLKMGVWLVSKACGDSLMLSLSWQADAVIEHGGVLPFLFYVCSHPVMRSDHYLLAAALLLQSPGWVRVGLTAPRPSRQRAHSWLAIIEPPGGRRDECAAESGNPVVRLDTCLVEQGLRSLARSNRF